MMDEAGVDGGVRVRVTERVLMGVIQDTLMPMVERLNRDNAREVAQAVLTYVQVLLRAPVRVPTTVNLIKPAATLQGLVVGLLKWAPSKKNRFKLQATVLLNKLCRFCGRKQVQQWVEDDEMKYLKYHGAGSDVESQSQSQRQDVGQENMHDGNGKQKGKAQDMDGAGGGGVARGKNGRPLKKRKSESAGQEKTKVSATKPKQQKQSGGQLAHLSAEDLMNQVADKLDADGGGVESNGRGGHDADARAQMRKDKKRDRKREKKDERKSKAKKQKGVDTGRWKNGKKG